MRLVRDELVEFTLSSICEVIWRKLCPAVPTVSAAIFKRVTVHDRSGDLGGIFVFEQFGSERMCCIVRVQCFDVSSDVKFPPRAVAMAECKRDEKRDNIGCDDAHILERTLRNGRQVCNGG